MNMRKYVLLLLAVLLTCMQGLLAADVITINENGTLSTNTYSNTYYVGADGKKALGSDVSEIKTAPGGVPNDVYGIQPSGGVAVSATSIPNGISLVSTGVKKVYGIVSDKSAGSVDVKSIGKIDVQSGGDAYGIYSTAGQCNVVFEGSKGSQAITARTTGTGEAYSIYANGNGSYATTISLKNCILSGKIKQGGTETLTININDGGVWSIPTSDTVSGNVSVNINLGGTIDLRSATVINNTANLGTASLTAQAGSKISFDAIILPTGLTTDQIKVSSGTGSIALGSINVDDSVLTNAFTGEKKATLIVDSSLLGHNNITITGEAEVAGEKGVYTFKGLINSQISVTMVPFGPISVTVGESGYATIYAYTNLVVPEGVSVFDLSYSDGAFEKVHGFGAGTIIEGQKGYVISANPGTYVFSNTTESAETCVSCLKGTLKQTTVNNVYVFAVKDGVPGFYTYTGSLAANKAYFQMPQ